jgi:hypothetical protein
LVNWGLAIENNKEKSKATIFGIVPALNKALTDSRLQVFQPLVGRSQMKKGANMPTHKERRRHPRVHIDWPVVIHRMDRTSAAVATDISARGALIRTHKPLLPKERFELFILVPDREAIKLKSAVIWLHVDCSEKDILPCGVGIRFTGVSRPDREFLTSWIKSQLTVSTS